MMTALLDSPNPAPASPEPSDQTGFQLQRIAANLLPDEIIAARRLSRLKRKVAFGIGVLVFVLALGYGYAWWQTRQAGGDLAGEQFTTAQLTAQLQKFDPLVQAQAQTTAIKSRLATAMSTDLQWSKLLGTLQRSAGSSVDITSLTASVDEDQGAADGLNPLNNSGLQIVGDLTVTGTTSDYRTVAAFVDRLSAVKGLAVVDPAQVTGSDRQVAFSVSLSLTTDALGGRFSQRTAATTPATTTGTTAPASQPTGGQ